MFGYREKRAGLAGETHSSGLVGIVGDLAPDLGEVGRVLDSDSLFLQELDGLIDRPVLIDGCLGETTFEAGRTPWERNNGSSEEEGE